MTTYTNVANIERISSPNKFEEYRGWTEMFVTEGMITFVWKPDTPHQIGEMIPIHQVRQITTSVEISE